MNGRAHRFRYLPVIVLGVLVLLAGGGTFWLVRSFLDSAPEPQKKMAQEIRIIRPPPPPELEPPPPPAPEEDVDVPEPEDPIEQPDSDQAAPAEQLGLDADGTAGGDGFGLVARKGGRDLLASGGSAYSWYAGLLKNEILDRLQDEKRARVGSFSVLVRVWVRQDGTIERIRLAQSSGDQERDQAIEQALSRIGRISQAPPADMPQPVSLRIVSRA